MICQIAVVEVLPGTGELSGSHGYTLSCSHCSCLPLSYVDQLKAQRPTPKIDLMRLSLEKIGSDRRSEPADLVLLKGEGGGGAPDILVPA
jgi:hypothetical protein